MLDGGAYVFESGLSPQLIARYCEDDVRHLLKHSPNALADEREEHAFERVLFDTEGVDTVVRLDNAAQFLIDRYKLSHPKRHTLPQEEKVYGKKGKLLTVSPSTVQEKSRSEITTRDPDVEGMSEKDAEVRHAPQSNSRHMFVLLVLLCVAGGVFLLQQNGIDFLSRGQGTEAPQKHESIQIENLSEYWRSGDREKQAAVAQAAVFDDDQKAQSEILKASLSGEVTGVVSDRLLFSAYQMPWAREYDRQDRKAVYYYATGALLNEESITLESFDKLHPGVLFALISSLDVNHAWVSQLPENALRHLSALPPPYGPLVQKLLDEGRSPEIIRAVVHVLSGSAHEAALNTLFASDHEAQWLPILGDLVPILSPEYGKMLELFLSSKSSKLKKLLKWYDDNGVVHWKDQPSAVRLLLVAGGHVPEDLPLELLADLLLFPVQSIREDAAYLLSQKIPDKDGNLLPTLQVLIRPEIEITRAQVVSLIGALRIDEEHQFALLEKWFESKPEVGAVVELLLARDQSHSVDPFNGEAVAYVRENEWELSFPKLQELAQHPEEVARILAIQRLDPENAREERFLKKRLSDEKSERVKTLIRARLRHAPSSSVRH